MKNFISSLIIALLCCINSFYVLSQNSAQSGRQQKSSLTTPISVIVTALPNSICFGDSAVITAVATGGSGNYTYTWGQGIGISTNTIAVSPATLSTYPVTVTDDIGSEAGVDSAWVLVYQLPVVQFTSDKVFDCAPMGVNFTDMSTPAISNWLWDFGDPYSGVNNNSTLQNPSHLYATAGTYTVTLNVTTTENCSGYSSVVNMINVCPAGIEDISSIKNITIFPNPATSTLSIITPQKSTIEIITLQGQIIKIITATESLTNIDISALARGMYYVKVRTEKDVAVRKFVKE